LAYSFPTDVRGSYYLVYELAEKGSLDAFLQTRDELKRLRLSFRRRVQIALDITTALRFLHVGNVERNVKSCFHRDVKSANIVLKQDLTAQLIDCGLAKFVVDKTDNGMAQSVSSNTPKGTPGYICPEYAHGEIACFDCACDVYSLGVVLVELWTGKLQNQPDGSGNPFNFAAQYIKLKKGKTARDILADADSTFGYAPCDVLPDYMIRFADLAKNCIGDHEDIPHGKDVLNELEAIRRSCLAEENGNPSSTNASTASFVQEPEAGKQQVCDRCQSFPIVSGGSTCRMCWDAEQQRTDIRGMRHEILLLLQTLGAESKATGTVLKTILQGVQRTSSHVQTISSVLGDLDMRISNPIPRLFFVVPAERKNALLHPKEYLHRSIATKYYLYFVCAHTKRPVDAPIKIHMTKGWVQKVAPVLAVSLHLLRCALSVLGLQVNLQGVFFQLSEGAVDDMLTEVATIIKDSGSHSDLLSHLAHRTLPFDVADVPELSGDVYDHLIEKATEQREWRQYMEPVRTESNAATLWVTKEVAEDARHGYIKAR
jgi:serine/threonine protein kinase